MTSIIGKTCSWRATTEVPSFGPIDARATLPFLIFMFHMRFWSLYLAVGTTVGFLILKIWRITPTEAIKASCFWIASMGFRRGHIGHRKGIWSDE
ncbi:MAG: IcmT/TraK family protein [Dokdonella sp.]